MTVRGVAGAGGAMGESEAWTIRESKIKQRQISSEGPLEMCHICLIY